MMQVRHDDHDLEALETSEAPCAGGMSSQLVRKFRKVMNLLRCVGDEREIYNYKSLHFEKLKGDRQHQRSVRLQDQWRLIIEIDQSASEKKNVLVIKGIENYH